MNDRSPIQQIFASYADCQFLDGEAVRDDDGTELQSAAWLSENRFDDYLDELAHALVEAGVGRMALMRVFLRHALRVLMENPETLHAGEEERKNISIIWVELFRNEVGMIQSEHEALRAKVLETPPTAFLVRPKRRGRKDGRGKADA